MNLSIRTAQAAKLHFKKIAIVEGNRQWTYGEFDGIVERLASGLAHGWPAGTRVGVMMANCAEAVMLQFALERANLVRVPINFRYTAFELSNLLTHCQAAVLFHDIGAASVVAAASGLPDGLHKVLADDGNSSWQALVGHAVIPELLHTSTPESLATINYTSGTTGSPKGVMLSHANWSAVYRNMLVDRDLRQDDVVAYVGPLTHASGAYLAPWFWRGARHIIVSPPTVDKLLDAIESEQVTAFTCVPTFLTKMLAHPDIERRELSSLRWIGYGAEPIPANTLERAWKRFGPVLWQNYGQTEAMMTCVFLSPHDHEQIDAEGRRSLRHNVIGRPYTFVEVVLRTSEGQAVNDGEVGEITVRADHVMSGYWEQPQATEATLRDGWLWTGDVAVRDAEGLIQLVGRRKEMLICGGFNIYPSEIETLLTRLPGVLEAAIIARPDPDWGEIAVAFVVAAEGVTLDPLALAVAVRPALGIKTPKAWYIHPELPKNSNGKIDKHELLRIDADCKQTEVSA